MAVCRSFLDGVVIFKMKANLLYKGWYQKHKEVANQNAAIDIKKIGKPELLVPRPVKKEE